MWEGITVGFFILALIALAPAPPTEPMCMNPEKVQGSAIYCCALVSGQQCCSSKLSGDNPKGCNCAADAKPKPKPKTSTTVDPDGGAKSLEE